MDFEGNAGKMMSWTPKRCRWDPENPPKFGLGLNLLFAFAWVASERTMASTFTVANLYYSHPILNILAIDFDVSNERASLIPTLMQAGYAAGLLFICPLGDIVRRRPFILCLIFLAATFWLGLCLTRSFNVFLALSFIVAATTVTPQLMVPLVGDLAPAHRRATSLSIVGSGLILGLLIARLLSGIMTQYTSWRSIYWFSLGMQYLIFTLLFFFLPDYPSTNPGGLNYFRMLYSIIKMLFKYPELIQACIIGLLVASTFTNYWTTLTFLLSSPPYNYTPLTIGLFALIGIAAMLLSPPYSRAVIDRLVPFYSVVLGLCYVLIGNLIGTLVGKSSIAGPIVQALALDFGIQTCQIANRAAIFSIDPRARNRVNTAFMLAVFCGQLMGTAVGNSLYARGGWVRSGAAGIGFGGAALVVCFARGPWEKGWLGWSGGWGWRRRDLGGDEGEPMTEQVLDESNAEEGGVAGRRENVVNEERGVEAEKGKE